MASFCHLRLGHPSAAALVHSLGHPCTTPCPTPTAALQTASDRLADSRAALERKAALYDRLARGEEDDEGGWRVLACTCVGAWHVCEIALGLPSKCAAKL